MFTLAKRAALVLVALTLTLGIVFISWGNSTAQSGKEMDRAALEMAAASYGVAADKLEISNFAMAEFPFTGKSIFHYKVLNKSTLEVYEVGLDAAGQAVDFAKLEADELAAQFAKYGRLEPAVFDWLASAPEGDVLDVAIWLKDPGIRFEKPAPEAINFASKDEEEAFYASVDVQQAALVEPLIAPVADYLVNQGYQVLTDRYTPVIFATLPAKAIREMAALDIVDKIYFNPPSQTTLDVAYYTTRVDIVYARRIAGFGVKLGEIEVGGQVATANPYLAGVTQDTTYSCLSSHTTGVAGIIRSIHPTYFGIAPAVNMWVGGSCGGSGGELLNRSAVALDWGARILNLSWGHDSARTPDSTARWYDTNTITRWRLFVVAAGNAGTTGCSQGTNGNVWSPGTAYNVVTVGNFNDLNTTSWTGDAMNACSSWRDPISSHSDREKPEVSAPGTNINSTTTASPWTGAIGSGTSYSAPIVTGVSALVLNRSWNVLNAWPETVKAMLMAGATHNIEGATRLSEYDGAGAVVADKIDDIGRYYNGNRGGLGYSCSTVTPLNVTTMALTAGVRTRVAIAWNNDPAYASYATLPGADLDLHIISPTGVLVASSVSYDNTYEIVDFTPSSTGTYTLRVVKVRCNYSPAYLGWTWTK